MKYKLFWATLIIIIIILSIILFINNPLLTGQTIIEQYTYTKALCNETNFCQDYIISCEGETIKNMSPISKATIQHSKEWIDPRNDTKIC